MFVSSDDLKNLLPAVISGGRPELKSRPTYKLLNTLDGKTADPVWIVREDQAGKYERDSHEIVTYSLDWARKYAQSHWTHPGGLIRRRVRPAADRVRQEMRGD